MMVPNEGCYRDVSIPFSLKTSSFHEDRFEIFLCGSSSIRVKPFGMMADRSIDQSIFFEPLFFGFES